MKTVNKLLIILTTLLISIETVNACPHVDEDGNAHFQFYNESYTEMIMMYPRENHLYNKTVVMETKELIEESFGFPIVQEFEAYLESYYFIDERLQTEDWESLEISTTVENISNLEVPGTGYSLDIGLTKSYSHLIELSKDITFQMFYNVGVTKKNDYSLLDDNNVEFLVEDTFEVSLDYSLINIENEEYYYSKSSLTESKDPITMYIESDNINENAIVVDLYEDLLMDNIIKTTYNTSENAYEFIINKPGNYTIITNEYTEDTEDEIVKNAELRQLRSETEEVTEEFDNEDTTTDETNKSNTPIIVLSSIGAAFIILMIFITK